MSKVSVIVPVYRVEKYIEKCVRSLFEQTLDDVEYIFVDDASPDHSIDIVYELIDQYPGKICKIIHHENNKGAAEARCTGLGNSNGEYIFFCDSDDWIEPTMLAEMYTLAEEQKSDIVICDFRMVFENTSIDFYSIDWSDNKVKSFQNYIASIWTVLCNMFVKRELYVKNPSITSVTSAKYCEDFNWAAKLLLHANKVVHLNKVLYNYNQLNLNSTMHNLNEKTMHDEQNMYLDVIDYFKSQGVYSLYEKQLCWRILKSTQEWILSTSTYNQFLNFYPDCHQYISSCPFINTKLKIMMWCLVHHLSLISRFMLVLRFLKHGKMKS